MNEEIYSQLTIDHNINVEWSCSAKDINEACAKANKLTESLDKLVKADKISGYYHSVINNDTHKWESLHGLGVDYESSTRRVTCNTDVTVRLDVEFDTWKDEPDEEDIAYAAGKQVEEILYMHEWDLEVL